MALWVKSVATKPDDLNSIPEAHMVQGKKRFPKGFFHTCMYQIDR